MDSTRRGIDTPRRAYVLVKEAEELTELLIKVSAYTGIPSPTLGDHR